MRADAPMRRCADADGTDLESWTFGPVSCQVRGWKFTWHRTCRCAQRCWLPRLTVEPASQARKGYGTSSVGGFLGGDSGIWLSDCELAVLVCVVLCYILIAGRPVPAGPIHAQSAQILSPAASRLLASDPDRRSSGNLCSSLSVFSFFDPLA